MTTVLLVLIYVAFVSLGLPDALLGAGWPVMQEDLGVPYSFAGIAQILISAGTIVSSMLCGSLLKRFGTGKLTAASVALTAVALFGFSIAPTFWWLLVAAIPLGLGGGAVDAGLNAYVASHYESRHMSWLHSFWGFGALVGPLALSVFLHQGHTWRMGYGSVAAFQSLLVLALLAAIPLWGKVHARKVISEEQQSHPHVSLGSALKIRGVKMALTVFLFYCGIEASMGLWAGSYLVTSHGMDPATAAVWVSLFYASLTLGRFITGFLTYRLSNNEMIRGGTMIALAGSVLMLLPVPLISPQIGLLLVGFGCAPIFPCMLHETPARFGAKNSQAIMGFQMAVAYTGTTTLPPLLGFLGDTAAVARLPYVILAYVILLLASFELLRRTTSREEG